MVTKGEITGNMAEEQSKLSNSLFSKLWPQVPLQLTVHDGAVFFGTKQWLEQIRQKEMKETDVVVTAYPKSGTTWVEEIVSVLSRDGDISESNKRPLHKRVPFLDIPSSAAMIPPASDDGKPRVINTHFFPEMFPTQIWEKMGKIVLVLRNPKAVMVSGFHFFQKLPLVLGPFNGTWEEYFQYFIGENVLFGNWFDHMESWWTYAQRENVHIVTYENLSRDLEGNIEKIAEFLNKDISKTTIKEIAKHVQFESMRDNPMTNHAQEESNCATALQRKGQVDDWKNYFTVAQNELFDRVYSQRINSESSLGIFLNDNIF